MYRSDVYLCVISRSSDQLNASNINASELNGSKGYTPHGFCYEASRRVRFDLLILEDVCNRNEWLQKLPQ